MEKESCDIGLIGLAVMGQNLVLNMNDHGYKVAVFNRTVSKVDDFVQHEAAGTQVVGTHSIEELASVLKRPRRVMLMVKAGDTVDAMIDQLLPKKAFFSSAAACRAEKKARVSALRSCRVAIWRRGLMSRKFSNPLPLKWMTAHPAATG
jgi:3-hydroxyisobutyrate dehydrogenase-like beta-hydroxyacid dehydrogenase